MHQPLQKSASEVEQSEHEQVRGASLRGLTNRKDGREQLRAREECKKGQAPAGQAQAEQGAQPPAGAERDRHVCCCVHRTCSVGRGRRLARVRSLDRLRP